MNKKLYVGNIGWDINSDSLKQLFAGIGKVASASVILDRDTGRSRGFGFVEMATEKEMLKAIEHLDGTDFEGRRIKVNEAKPEGGNTAREAPGNTKEEIRKFFEKFVNEDAVLNERVGFTWLGKHFVLYRDK